MPDVMRILLGLKILSRQFFPLAVIWHILFLIGIIALVAGWRPTRRQAGVVLTLPILSVSVLALITANIFNGLLFAVLFLVLVTLSARMPEEKVTTGWNIFALSGAIMIALGWFYPHFLPVKSLVPYLYGAPTGIVPCPTLAIVIGFTLLFNALKSKAWSLVLGFFGLFYGLFGAIRLGVSLDYGLVAGSLILILVKIIRKVERE